MIACAKRGDIGCPITCNKDTITIYEQINGSQTEQIFLIEQLIGYQSD